MRTALACILLIPMVFLGPGCRGTHRSSGLKVTASLFPLADIVRKVGGESVDVHVLLPAGASPHTFEPTPGQLRELSGTRLLVLVGAGLEFWAEKLATASAGESLRVIRAADGVALIPLEGEEAHEHEAGGNPHVWLDPVVMKAFVDRIERALVEIDPGNAASYRRNAEAYRAALDSLDQEIRATVEGFSIKEYVAFHPAWAYFARRYGLNQVGLIEASPGREPTPKQLKAIVENVRKFGIRAVFAEPQLNPTAAQVIACEAGVKVLVLDPLGGPDLPDRDSYLRLMRYNLRVMKEAMG